MTCWAQPRRNIPAGGFLNPYSLPSPGLSGGPRVVPVSSYGRGLRFSSSRDLTGLLVVISHETAAGCLFVGALDAPAFYRFGGPCGTGSSVCSISSGFGLSINNEPLR
jgi:hypothetical protein